MPRRKGSLNKKTTAKVLNALMDGPLYIRQIYRKTGLGFRTITYVLKVLEERGWVVSWKEKNRKVYSLTLLGLNQFLSNFIAEKTGAMLLNSVPLSLSEIIQSWFKEMELVYKQNVFYFNKIWNEIRNVMDIQMRYFEENNRAIKELKAEAKKDGFSIIEFPFTEEVVRLIEYYKRYKQGFRYLRQKGLSFFDALRWARTAQQCLLEEKMKSIPFSQRRVERRKRLFEIPEGYQPTLYPLNQNVLMRRKSRKIK